MKHILPLLMILLVTACSSRPTTSGIGVEQTGQRYNQQLIIDNPELAKKLAITDVKTRQTNGLTDVVVTLASRYKKVTVSAIPIHLVRR